MADNKDLEKKSISDEALEKVSGGVRLVDGSVAEDICPKCGRPKTSTIHLENCK